MKAAPLIFLKLGGSLITDKDQPMTPRPALLTAIAGELRRALNSNPDMRLLIGHGSGSFGHAAAKPFGIQNGVQGEAAWRGFAAVWAAARNLNQIVIDHLLQASLPVIAFPPSAGVLSRDRSLKTWDLRPIRAALSHGLIPVVQGDVIFDEALGGTIFSTETIFLHLAQSLHPDKILLAGIEEGVWWDPANSQDIIPKITPDNFGRVLPGLTGSHSVDVTGGMLAKVRLMLDLVKDSPHLEVRIFSGKHPGRIEQALAGKAVGTRITR
jgi:isopentenyl phosphate kinase